MGSETKTRYCILEPSQGLVTVKFIVPRHMVAGADFKVYLPGDKKPKEEWKMSAEDDSYALKTVKTELNELNKATMVWQILCCSLKASIYDAVFEVEVQQNMNTCRLTIPGKWHRTSVPPCSVNNPESFAGSLTFIIKS